MSSPIETSPFESPTRHPVRRRMGMIAGAALLLVGAFAAVYMATRKSPDASVVPAGHNHGGAAPATEAGPVMLSRADADRIGVTFAPVTLAPLVRELRAVGIVSYDETRVKVIAPKIDGWVEQLYLNFTGQPVRRGDALFTIYAPMLVTAQEELLLARRLAADVQNGSPEARRSAEELVASARRRLSYWDIPAADIDAIETSGQVRRTLTLRSPIDGFVVDKPVLSGRRIMAGDAVYRIADLSTVWVDGEIYEQYAPLARVGAPTTMDFASLPGKQRTGRVAYVYPTVNQDTRTLRVRVALPNVGAELKPGMYATMVLKSWSERPVLTVPRSAVLATGRRVLVFVRASNGALVPKDVTIGDASDDRVVVLSGLSVGDTVVASATFLVDAESNLKSALGGMGNMPGMNMGGASEAPPPAGPRPAGPAPDSMSKKPAMPDMPGMEDMPGMNHGSSTPLAKPAAKLNSPSGGAPSGTPPSVHREY